MNLLERAKKVKTTRKSTLYSNEEMELAIGWAKDEVQTTQVIKARGWKVRAGGGIYCFLAGALRQAMRERRLKEKGWIL